MERYKKGEASRGNAAELAGVRVGQMMALLTEFEKRGDHFLKVFDCARKCAKPNGPSRAPGECSTDADQSAFPSLD